MNPDPLRPVETDLDRVTWMFDREAEALIYAARPYSMGIRLGFLLALACGFIAGVLVMWVLR